MRLIHFLCVWYVTHCLKLYALFFETVSKWAILQAVSQAENRVLYVSVTHASIRFCTVQPSENNLKCGGKNNLNREQVTKNYAPFSFQFRLTLLVSSESKLKLLHHNRYSDSGSILISTKKCREIRDRNIPWRFKICWYSAVASEKRSYESTSRSSGFLKIRYTSTTSYKT